MSLTTSHPGYPIILGVMASGDLVTLTNAEMGSMNMSVGDVVAVRVQLQPMYVFRGAHLEDGARTRFAGFKVHFEHLEEWADPGQRIVSWIVGSNGTQFEMGEASNLECEAFGGKLKVTYTTSQQLGTTKAVIERLASIEFDSTEPTEVSALSQSVSVPLQYLLTFSCGLPVHPTSFSVRLEGVGRQVGSVWLPTWIEMGFRGWHAPTGAKPPVILRLPLIAIRDRFEEIIRSWDSLYQEQERAMVLLFAISLGLDLYVDSRFLFAVQAVELYHRKRWPTGVVPKSAHKKRVKAIVDLLSEQTTKKWVKDKLAYSNEPTLRERLDRMVEHAGPEVNRVLRSNFSKIAADTRNYLTHYTPRLKDKAAEGEDLYDLGLEVIALLEFCLLRDLGFDSSTSLQLSSQTPVFRSLLHRRGQSSPVITAAGNNEPSGAAGPDEGMPDVPGSDLSDEG